MKQKKDTRFLLTSFFEEQEQTKHTYKSFQNQIENNGCFIVNLIFLKFIGEIMRIFQYSTFLKIIPIMN